MWDCNKANIVNHCRDQNHEHDQGEHINHDRATSSPTTENSLEAFAETWFNIDPNGPKNQLNLVAKSWPRKNLRDLCGSFTGGKDHYGRRFWAWLNKQPWRRMFPQPTEFHVSDIMLFRDRFNFLTCYIHSRFLIEGVYHCGLGFTVSDCSKLRPYIHDTIAYSIS